VISDGHLMAGTVVQEVMQRSACHQNVAELWRQGDLSGIGTGYPVKLAQALITISSQDKPPRRFIAGADAVGTAEKVAATLQQQTDAYVSCPPPSHTITLSRTDNSIQIDVSRMTGYDTSPALSAPEPIQRGLANLFN
jgi:hypothetical protein